MTEGRLYAEDIARLRGVSVRAGRRELARLRDQHGPDVVGTEWQPSGGRPRLYTTREQLAKLAPSARREAVSSDRRLDDLEALVASLGREVEEIRRRIDAR